MPVMLNTINMGLLIVSLGQFNLKRLARNVAVEGIEYQRATGKNPLMDAPTVIGGGAIELAISAFGLAGDIASIGGLAIPEAGVEAVIDNIIGRAVENRYFPKQVIGGKTYEIKAAEHAVTFAEWAPIVPVIPTVSALQWWGRSQLRREIREVDKKK